MTFLLFHNNCPIKIGSGSFPVKTFSMASRLAVLALLLVFAVWGTWLNYVATARVEGEAGKQIQLFFIFRRFFSPTSVITFLFASLAAVSCEDHLCNYFSCYIHKRPCRVATLGDLKLKDFVRRADNCEVNCATWTVSLSHIQLKYVTNANFSVKLKLGKICRYWTNTQRRFCNHETYLSSNYTAFSP